MATEVKQLDADVVVTKDTFSDDDHHQSGAIEWTAEDERRIRQRMDWRIVPIVLALYLMCFIDRSEIYIMMSRRINS
jgi:MFS transporter, ACS family, DAL5 transporter family protein